MASFTERFSPRALNATLGSSALVAWTAGSIAYNNDVALPTCPFKALTGLDCPGCGSTRAGASLLRGDVIAALDQHAVIIGTPAVIALLWLLKVVSPKLRPLWVWLERRPASATLVVIGTFWAMRLLPFAPFTFLAAGRAV